MPFTGDMAALKRLLRATQELARPGSPAQRAVMAPVVPAVKALFAQQFAEGIDPEGARQPARKDGKPALRSKKLSRGAITVTIEGTGIRVRAKTAHLDDILTTQDEGHTFAAHKSTQFRGRGKASSTGRLLKRSAFLRRIRDAAVYHGKGSDEWSYTKTNARGRTRFVGERRVVAIGRRVLRARRIRPHGSELPARYGAAVARGAFIGLRGWYDRVK